jgi:hypothetical protein
LTDSNQINCYVSCKFGEKCSKILSGRVCSHYHDPLSLLKLKEKIASEGSSLSNWGSGVSPEELSDLVRHYSKRNFSNKSWLYKPANMVNSASEKHMRHIGNENTLLFDMEQSLQIDRNYDWIHAEFDMRCSQLMHDLLILLTMRDHINQRKPI